MRRNSPRPRGQEGYGCDKYFERFRTAPHPACSARASLTEMNTLYHRLALGARRNSCRPCSQSKEAEYQSSESLRRLKPARPPLLIAPQAFGPHATTSGVHSLAYLVKLAEKRPASSACKQCAYAHAHAHAHAVAMHMPCSSHAHAMHMHHAPSGDLRLVEVSLCMHVCYTTGG